MASTNLGRVQGKSIWSGYETFDDNPDFNIIVKLGNSSIKPLIGDLVVSSEKSPDFGLEGDVFELSYIGVENSKGDLMCKVKPNALFNIKGPKGAQGPQGPVGSSGYELITEECNDGYEMFIDTKGYNHIKILVFGSQDRESLLGPIIKYNRHELISVSTSDQQHVVIDAEITKGYQGMMSSLPTTLITYSARSWNDSLSTLHKVEYTEKNEIIKNTYNDGLEELQIDIHTSSSEPYCIKVWGCKE